MARRVVFELATGAILVVDPPMGVDGQAIMPRGVECGSVMIADVEYSKLSTPDASFTVTPDGVVTARTVAQPPEPLRVAVINAAQSAVGVNIATLTQAQRLALVTCLLYKAGAVDPTTLVVKPLSQWL
jgi:hypothetical protein